MKGGGGAHSLEDSFSSCRAARRAKGKTGTAPTPGQMAKSSWDKKADADTSWQTEKAAF